MALGELEIIIGKLRNVDFKCTCGETFKLSVPETYPHDGGLQDSNGQRMWLYYTCPKCKYQWAYWKILKRINFAK